MSYKVNGNVVIDNTGNAVGLTNLAFVKTPVNVSPAEGANAYASIVTLEATDYEGLYIGTIPHKFSQFQVANASSFAAANIVYDSGNIAGTSSNVVPLTLELGEYYWRVRYTSNNDVTTDFSASTSFNAVTPPPLTLGESYGGGYYTGVIDIGSNTCYYIIVSPISTGQAAGCRYKCGLVESPNSACASDGYYNTYCGFLCDGVPANAPAGNWTATRTIGGYTDWYLPSRTETGCMYTYRSCLPPGEYTLGPAPADQDKYWTSTCGGTCGAYIRCFDNGNFGIVCVNCYNNFKTRAVRRISFSDF